MSEVDALSIHDLTPAEDGANNQRCLEDNVLVAFHQACEQRDEGMAKHLLAVVEFIWMRERDDPGRRRNAHYLVAARERYRQLARATGGRR